ncbi:hypothetical protein FI667_g10602, partial [Globisporangium splendens]
MKQVAESGEELSDKEWRQMHRTLSQLQFEPVPETPALLPRSLYDENDEDDNEQVKDDEAELEPAKRHQESDEESVQSLTSNHQESPPGNSTRQMSDARATTVVADIESGRRKSPTKQISFELPSTSTSIAFDAVPPPAPASSVSAFPPRPTSLLPTRKKGFNYALLPVPRFAFKQQDKEAIAAIDTHMIAAQDAMHQAVMVILFTKGVLDAQAKWTQDVNLERMKTAATHANDIAMLQNKIEELKEFVVQTDKYHSHQGTILERYSTFTAKRALKNTQIWPSPQSVLACFLAWRSRWEMRKAYAQANRRAARHLWMRCEKTHLEAWKSATMQSQFVHRVQHLQVEHEHHLVETVNEYQLQIQQLQQQLEEAKHQIAVSEKRQHQLEENVGQVFLRGVSTMNMEALTLFNSNHQQMSKRDSEDDVTQQRQSDRGDGAKEKRGKPDSRTNGLKDDLEAAWGSSSKRSDERHYQSAEAGSDSGRAFPERLTGQPMSRDDLDAKLNEMLVTSTNRLECSQNPNRVGEIQLRQRNASSSSSNLSPCPVRHKPGVHSSSSTSVLRSAEMVQQHYVGIMAASGGHRAASSTFSFEADFSSLPTSKSKASASTKYQVEMEYMRSTIATGGGTSLAAVRPRSSSNLRARSPLRSSSGSSSSSRFKY